MPLLGDYKNWSKQHQLAFKLAESYPLLVRKLVNYNLNQFYSFMEIMLYSFMLNNF